MITLYFDTETTGLRESQICQLAYIIDDGTKIYGKNFFFSVADMNEYAYRVHGFSKEDLELLSKGRMFKDCYREINEDFNKASVLVAHNAKFDINMMTLEYKRLGKVFEYNNHLCTMRTMTNYMQLPKAQGKGFKPPSLSEFANYYIDDKGCSINNYVKKIFGVDSRYHDARFDTTSMFLALRKAMSEQSKLREKVCNLV